MSVFTTVVDQAFFRSLARSPTLISLFPRLATVRTGPPLQSCVHHLSHGHEIDTSARRRSVMKKTLPTPEKSVCPRRPDSSASVRTLREARKARRQRTRRLAAGRKRNTRGGNQGRRSGMNSIRIFLEGRTRLSASSVCRGPDLHRPENCDRGHRRNAKDSAPSPGRTPL